MKLIDFEYIDIKKHIDDDELKEQIESNLNILDVLYKQDARYADSLGWMVPEEWVNEETLSYIEEMVDRIHSDCDVFVLVGIGGSNQGARAVIKACQPEGGPEIVYAGNNISAHYMNKLLKRLENKSVYINVIAKNFETLEPGISFRFLREYLYNRYGNEANKRIVVTGTKGSRLYEIAQAYGFGWLTFPDNMGGRFSVLSDVGLYPIAVSGIDIRSMAAGAMSMRDRLYSEKGSDNIALRYATIRNLLLQKGYSMEMLAFFEPQFEYFSKWWTQLFAESEGKEGKGLYPVSVSMSEDLHSVGQYIQEGQPILFETFIDVQEKNSSLVINKDFVDDAFDFVNGKDFWEINKAAFEATFQAHTLSGIPCMKLTVPKINAYYFGQLFYFFEYSCYLSGEILCINPFDQPGVEAYKGYMFDKLGKIK